MFVTFTHRLLANKFRATPRRYLLPSCQTVILFGPIGLTFTRAMAASRRSYKLEEIKRHEEEISMGARFPEDAPLPAMPTKRERKAISHHIIS